MHQHTDIGGATVSRHFAPGERPDHLLIPTHRIHRRNGYHLNFRTYCSRTHRSQGSRLIRFYPHHHFDRTHRITNQAHPFDDFGGAFAHQPVIAGNIRFAFAAVDNQGAHIVFTRQIQFDRRRKSRPAQAYDTGCTHRSGNLFR